MSCHGIVPLRHRGIRSGRLTVPLMDDDDQVNDRMRGRATGLGEWMNVGRGGAAWEAGGRERVLYRSIRCSVGMNYLIICLLFLFAVLELR